MFLNMEMDIFQPKFNKNYLLTIDKNILYGGVRSAETLA
jgi:hypothetical protein